MFTPASAPLPLPAVRIWPAALAWAAAWGVMLAAGDAADIANRAVVLVLASAVAALWLPVWASMLASAAAVMAFNWAFVPPLHTFTADLRQHAVLLGAMLAVSWIVAAIMAGQRRATERARQHAHQVDQGLAWGAALRDAADPLEAAGLLRDTLAQATGAAPLLLLLERPLPPANEADAALLLGTPDVDQLAGLWLCLRQSTPFGPGTGRHQELAEWYLPMRGRKASFGAAALRLADPARADPTLRAHLQSLCDQMGLALQRAQTAQAAVLAREAAQTQAVHNAMLAAISHDYRTPLATILGAASSLLEQGERLSAAQRERLAASIVDETRQLGRLTDNTLQLARLDAPGVTLRLDWESCEEIVGSVLRRARRHDPERRVRARLEPGLPLVRCDALLLAQLLDNLVDNALKYSDAPVEIFVRRIEDHVVFAVRDRGPGVPPAWRERIFEVFRRGPADAGAETAARRGAGVGLAVCRAIARAHGGDLKLRARGHGGSSFECRLRADPPPPVERAGAEDGEAQR